MPARQWGGCLALQEACATETARATARRECAGAIAVSSVRVGGSGRAAAMGMRAKRCSLSSVFSAPSPTSLDGAQVFFKFEWHRLLLLLFFDFETITHTHPKYWRSTPLRRQKFGARLSLLSQFVSTFSQRFVFSLTQGHTSAVKSPQITTKRLIKAQTLSSMTRSEPCRMSDSIDSSCAARVSAHARSAISWPPSPYFLSGL